MRAPGGSSRPRLYALVTLMTLLWALNFTIGKIALREFPDLLVVGLRFALAGVLIYPYYLWHSAAGSVSRPRREDWPWLIGLGVFGVGLNQLFFVLGLARTSASHAAFLIALVPILVLLMAAVARQERLSPRKLAGLGLAAVGVVALQTAPARLTAASVQGDLLILGSALCFAFFTVAGKEKARHFAGLTMNTVAYVGSGLVLLPLTLWLLWRFPLERVSPAAWASVVYMALFPSVVCYMIYYHALQHLPASRVAALSYLQPVIATAMAIPLLGEPLTRPLVAGGALVLSGVYLAERRR